MPLHTINERDGKACSCHTFGTSLESTASTTFSVCFTVCSGVDAGLSVTGAGVLDVTVSETEGLIVASLGEVKLDTDGLLAGIDVVSVLDIEAWGLYESSRPA